MKIYINGYQVLFGGEISFSIVNSLFSDEISSSLTYILQDDDAGINRRALGYISRVDILDNKSREYSQIIECGMHYLTGTVVAKYQNGAFNCYFKSNGDFWSLIQNKLLSEMPLDSVNLENLTEEEFQNFIEDCLRTDLERSFTFPTIINKKIFDNFPVKFDFSGLINAFTNHIVRSANNPVIPFIYLQYLYRAIFEKNGINIRENVFSTYPELARFILANNYIINEYEIDTTVLDTVPAIIQKIESGKDPLVTTPIPHNLSPYQYLRVKNVHPLNNELEYKIFQAEVIDAKNFKLLGAETSQEYDKVYIETTEWQKFPDQQRLMLTPKEPLSEELLARINIAVYLRSNDWNGAIVVHLANSMTIDAYFNNIPIDWNNTFFTQTTLLELHTTDPISGTIEYLPQNLKNIFRKIDLKNHVPVITVHEFLKQAFMFTGIVAFVRDGSKTVDLKSIRDIILSKDYIDISEYCGIVDEIVNPDLEGFVLQMVADGTDEYYKNMLPVSEFKSEYNFKDPVLTKNDLPVPFSETNDVRYVVGENAFYIFSKSFLNSVNGWKFLVYNLLDYFDGNKEYKHQTLFSTLLPEKKDNKTYASMHVKGECFTFLSEKTKTNPRILYYHGELERGYNLFPYASGDNTDENGNVVPGSTYKFRWDTENGLYEKVWKEYIHWRINVYKECQCLIQWPDYLIVNFDASKKYRIHGVDYFVKKIPVVLTQERKAFTSKTELVKA